MVKITKPSFAVDVKTATTNYNTELCESQISITVAKDEVTLWVPPYLHHSGRISFPKYNSIEDTLVDINSYLYELLVARGNVEDYGNAWEFDYNAPVTVNDVESAIHYMFHWGFKSDLTPNLYLKLNTDDDNIWCWSIEVWNEKQFVEKVNFEDLAKDFNDLFFDGIGAELTDSIYNIVKNIK